MTLSMPCARGLVVATLLFAGFAAHAQAPTPAPAPAPKPPEAAAPAAPAAASPAPPTQKAEVRPLDLHVTLKSLEEWDNAADALVKLTWQVHNGHSSLDLGGHELAYYWDQYVKTSATKEKLDVLRDKAQKQSVAKDTAGLQKSLDEASALLTDQRVKAFAISMFLSAQEPIIYHQYQLGPWLARATDQDRQGINDRVTATYAGLLRELDAVMKLPQPENPGATVQRFYRQLAEPAAFFNAERQRLVKAQAQLPNPVAVSARTRGDKACPAPVSPVKGREKPSLGPDFPSSEGFYPPAAKQNDVQGAVTLRAAISETGCIQRAEVVGTSGVAELDEGALSLAMAGSYAPGAGADGKPVAGTMMFRVKFEQPGVFDSAR
jgi:TonB family protein